MVKYRKHGLRMAETWMDSPLEKPEQCDVMLLGQYSSLPKGAFGWPFTSLTINLQADEDALLDGLNRGTKYEIRRAAKDQIECIHEVHATDELCLEFHAYYSDFASEKGLPAISLEELIARKNGNILRFSRALHAGTTVVWHVHVVTDNAAILLHSASQFRQLDSNEARAIVGRANRLLHWHDILAFKAEGKRVYDFGGWYPGTDDAALLRINQFKEGFGGTRTEQVNAAIALSWRGWLYLNLRQYFSGKQRRAAMDKMLAFLQFNKKS